MGRGCGCELGASIAFQGRFALRVLRNPSASIAFQGRFALRVLRLRNPSAWLGYPHCRWIPVRPLRGFSSSDWFVGLGVCAPEGLCLLMLVRS